MKRRGMLAAVAVAMPAAAQSPRVPFADAPAAWRDYALAVEALVRGVLGADDAADLRGSIGDAGLRVRVWIAPDGRFSRLVGDDDPPGTTAELMRLLAATRAPAPPPDMRFPMTLLLRLDAE